ncbi:MAG: ABC transporter substrate-binding protein, partial [Bacillota bacterium]|nr:ABC transporter substrate-binding protein [Bacillota bacterium]
TWTFKIRDDVKFTDGEALTASDVAFTYNEALKQATETDLSMLDSVEAIDDTTAVFHLNKPYSAFGYVAAVVGIVPEHAYDSASYGQNPIGSGRYILKQWDKGEQIILEANEDYYGEKPSIDKVTVVFMDEDASYAAAKSGQVDLAYTAPAFTQKPVDGYEILAFDSVDIRGINMPTVPSGASTPADKNGETLPAGNDVTSELAIRQALAAAIDREAIVKDVLYGYGVVAYSDCVGEPWYNDAMEVEYSPEKAKAIMEKDGWTLNNEGVYEKDGKTAEFDMLYMANDSARTGIAMAVAEMAQKVGIKINTVGKSWDEISSLYYETPHVFGAGMHSPTGVISHYYSDEDTANGAMYSNDEVNEQVNLALAAKTVEESYPYWKAAQAQVAPDKDSPWIWICEIQHIYFAKDGLKVVDHKIHPHGYGWTILNNVHQWSWE